MNRIGVEVVNPLKLFAHTNWPGDRGTLDFQDIFNFIQHFDLVTHLTVHLVDKSKDRRITHTTHLH